jgi:hypothetical protein
MSRKLLFLLLALVVVIGAIVWLDQVDDQKAPMYQLGNEHCILKTKGIGLVPGISPAREQFIRHCWVDSSLHFYSKALILNEQDTFLVSTFTKPQKQQLLLKCQQTGAALKERKKNRHSEGWFLKQTAGFTARWIFPEENLNALLLIDYFHKDSLKVRRQFEANPLHAKVGKCLK